MTVPRKLTVIAILTSFAFWIPIFTIFMQARGVSETMVYLLITIYSFAVVLLEYPTGVIGDYFSHRYSAIAGYLVMGITDLLIAINTTNPVLYFGFVIFMSLGMTLVSGSDSAYRYDLLGDNFRKVYPKIKGAGTLATLIGIVLGPLLYQLHPVLPFAVNGTCFLVAALITFTLPRIKKVNATTTIESTNKANIFALGKKGITVILHSRTLQSILLLSAIVSTLAINMKWIYPELFARTGFPLVIWGALISSFYLARTLGTFLYKRIFFERQRLFWVVLLTLSVVLLGFNLGKVVLYLLLFLEFLIVGILETDIDIHLQQAAESTVRASVLSFNSLTARLFSGLHIALLGIIGVESNFWIFTLVTALLVLILGSVAQMAFPKEFPKSHSTSS